MKEIDVHEAHRRMQDGTARAYLDVRTEEEFATGHPEGALNVPAFFRSMGQLKPNPDFVAAVGALFAKDTPLVLGCRTGARSRNACGWLEAAGFSAVDNVAGSMAGVHDDMGRVVAPGWAEEGLPVAHTLTDENTWTGLKKKAGIP